MPVYSTCHLPTIAAEAPHQWSPNSYLTNGTRLLRTVSTPIMEWGEGLVAVEDCLTLDVIICSQDELAALRYQLVWHSPACS